MKKWFAQIKMKLEIYLIKVFYNHSQMKVKLISWENSLLSLKVKIIKWCNFQSQSLFLL